MSKTPDTDLSPILEALYRGQDEEAEALAASNPELDVFEASALGRTARLQDLLDEDPQRVNAWSGDGFLPIHLAAFFGHAAAAELLAERGADLKAVSRHVQIVVTPLHSAVAREGGEDARTVEVLLEHDAPPNAKAEGGGTPLHSAAANGNADIVRLLLAHGADPSAPRDDGKTPLDLAREGGHDDLARMLG
jgi:ankyrin repeat protein